MNELLEEHKNIAKEINDIEGRKNKSTSVDYKNICALKMRTLQEQLRQITMMIGLKCIEENK